ncbi:LuxR C-terminal-related transcriptional regulator [Bradyrhizobium sp. UFLA03-84]|uniref:LuxR C-terminal-related transcriptional regulator n=1 Tax=Bradyrhizobium sp. UFLA03-84 TaxID=418599 RepID=UPI001FD89788|nr:LuxR C-terminal-related transcriptional regulator [Bradyrhizobium sp. UFLA03-84]
MSALVDHLNARRPAYPKGPSPRRPLIGPQTQAPIEAAFAGADASIRAERIADATRRVDSFSPREREVLEGLIGGRSNTVIAHQLGRSVRTIGIRRARIMRQLAGGSASASWRG